MFLVAAQSTLVRSDLDFNEAQLGLAIAVFFAMGALCSTGGGRISERLGPRTGMLITVATTTALCLVVAAAADTWAQLVVLLGVAGAVNAVAQTSGDLAVARGVPSRVQGLAMGVKTSCLPLATLFAGAAIPGIGVRYGWRVSFVAVAALAAVLVLLVPQRHSFVSAPATRTSLNPDMPTATLVVLAIGGALSTGAVNTTWPPSTSSRRCARTSPPHKQGGGWPPAASRR